MRLFTRQQEKRVMIHNITHNITNNFFIWYENHLNFTQTLATVIGVTLGVTITYGILLILGKIVLHTRYRKGFKIASDIFFAVLLSDAKEMKETPIGVPVNTKGFTVAVENGEELQHCISLLTSIEQQLSQGAHLKAAWRKPQYFLSMRKNIVDLSETTHKIITVKNPTVLTSVELDTV